MNKKILPLLLIVSFLTFNSCEDGALTKVSTEEAALALSYVLLVNVSSLSLLWGGTLDGATYDATTGIITYTAYDISDISEYASISGTYNTDTGAYDFAFSGGPVVTLVFDETSYIVNGHDMTSDL